MTSLADEAAVKATEIAQEEIAKPIVEGVESALAKVPGEKELVEETVAPLERALGADVPLPKFDAPSPGMARVPAPGGGTIEVPITRDDEFVNKIDSPQGDFINDLDSKLEGLRDQRIIKTKAFNFQLDSEGNLRIPKNARSIAAQKLFTQISEDPRFTAEEREHLLSSFSPKTKQLVQGQELAQMIPAPDLGTVRLGELKSDISPQELLEGLKLLPDITTLQIPEDELIRIGKLGPAKGKAELARFGLSPEEMEEAENTIIKHQQIRRAFKNPEIAKQLTEGMGQEDLQRIEKITGRQIRPVEIPKVKSVEQTLAELESKPMEQIKSLPKGKEMLDPSESLVGSRVKEQPTDKIPLADEPIVPGEGELTEAKTPFDLPEESSSEQGFLGKALDKIKSGNLSEGFSEVKSSRLYKGTLSALRSDFTKGLLSGAGLSAAGIGAYEALLQEDSKGDLNLIPTDLENLDKTLKKLDETFKLAKEIGKLREDSRQRFNTPTLDPVENRKRQNDLEKLELEDRLIKKKLAEMKRRTETTMQLLKNKDAKNDALIKKQEAIRKAKTQTSERRKNQELRNLKKRVLQPVQKDIAPRFKISINNNPRNTNTNRVDPKMTMNQTQM